MEQQKEMLKGHRDEIIIAVALASMPNIRRVTLPNHWCPARDLLGTSYFSPWRPMLPRGVRVGGPLSRGPERTLTLRRSLPACRYKADAKSIVVRI
ncbi:hypothetical protein MAA_11779 [Metarhizium robertsii ARSEF 23]|uniref:Uncharacterized protein n=1 Tax=Metarhizium robertsii (strain ARSEF 23 / ATCC MYA-3075) TaxID=655844 RepID=A0A0B2X6Y5_METRA|nr:uncharacterized protein MAA_11779 [Metarhizium robertsii ARSEF 23]KHO10623.1 hypothetical protein MAA_11779 [Metarhizium robertsii ARSEF 23]